MSQVFVVGDLHFGQARAIPARFRTGLPLPEQTHDAYCEWVVRQWNSVVGRRDKVYVLGDFSFTESALYSYACQLRGSKELIMGNHDTQKADDYLLAGFDALHGAKEYKGAILTHIPVHPAEAAYYRFNVHGHCHDGADYGPLYFNAIPEVVGYKPVPWTHVETVMREQIKGAVRPSGKLRYEEK